MFKIGFGQKLVPFSHNGWEIDHYQGSCYHDTIIHAVWLYIEPNQELRKYDYDTSFVVVEVIAVNKSPIDIYLHGNQNNLKAIVIKESYVLDTTRRDSSYYLRSGMPPRKLDKRLAFEMKDYSKNPHKDLWRENQDELILIKQGSRRKLLATIPKRYGLYRINGTVEFNKERFAYDCDGIKVTWSRCRIIESNRIELKEKRE